MSQLDHMEQSKLLNKTVLFNGTSGVVDCLIILLKNEKKESNKEIPTLLNQIKLGKKGIGK